MKMQKLPSSDALLQGLMAVLDSAKAEAINPINLADKTDIADYMLIASGTSGRHVQALARQVHEYLSDKGLKGIRPEGDAADEWIVVDAYSIVVHLFTETTRQHYSLDKMWMDIPDTQV